MLVQCLVLLALTVREVNLCYFHDYKSICDPDQGIKRRATCFLKRWSYMWPYLPRRLSVYTSSPIVIVNNAPHPSFSKITSFGLYHHLIDRAATQWDKPAASLNIEMNGIAQVKFSQHSRVLSLGHLLISLFFVIQTSANIYVLKRCVSVIFLSKVLRIVIGYQRSKCEL